MAVALRKESVDRNKIRITTIDGVINVALRKESVDRNDRFQVAVHFDTVALRKESVDRNGGHAAKPRQTLWSLSARRAWIEISMYAL